MQTVIGSCRFAAPLRAAGFFERFEFRFADVPDRHVTFSAIGLVDATNSSAPFFAAPMRSSHR